MSNHVEYFDKSVKILKKYSLGGIVEGVPIDTINELIKQHELELISCDTFDKAMDMANRALCDVSGFPMKIQSFISQQSWSKKITNCILITGYSNVVFF